MKSICKEFGFSSKNARAYARKGSDHHKLWDIIEVRYTVFTDKLLLDFSRVCKQKTVKQVLKVNGSILQQ